jgi:hypothetical protein
MAMSEYPIISIIYVVETIDVRIGRPSVSYSSILVLYILSRTAVILVIPNAASAAIDNKSNICMNCGTQYTII